MSKTNKNEGDNPPQKMTRMVIPASQDDRGRYGARLPKPPLQMQRPTNPAKLKDGQPVPKQPPAPPASKKTSK